MPRHTIDPPPTSPGTAMPEEPADLHAAAAPQAPLRSLDAEEPRAPRRLDAIADLDPEPAVQSDADKVTAAARETIDAVRDILSEDAGKAHIATELRRASDDTASDAEIDKVVSDLLDGGLLDLDIAVAPSSNTAETIGFTSSSELKSDGNGRTILVLRENLSSTETAEEVVRALRTVIEYSAMINGIDLIDGFRTVYQKGGAYKSVQEYYNHSFNMSVEYSKYLFFSMRL